MNDRDTKGDRVPRCHGKRLGDDTHVTHLVGWRDGWQDKVMFELTKPQRRFQREQDLARDAIIARRFA